MGSAFRAGGADTVKASGCSVTFSAAMFLMSRIVTYRVPEEVLRQYVKLCIIVGYSREDGFQIAASAGKPLYERLHDRW